MGLTGGAAGAVDLWFGVATSAWVAVLVVGTVVTGSGPHSGDPKAGRTGFDPALVSQLHADVVFLLVGLFYFAIAFPLSMLSRLLAHRLSRGRRAIGTP